ncbi:HLH-domain-containing protein [Lichtheimia hyalospora FSU 10163]|nr:HLH-domain-containing protein [Lichtheimia hyalospora FSU 10163]
MSTAASPTTPPSPPKSSSPTKTSNTLSSPTTSVVDKTSNTAATNKRKRVSTTSESSSTTHSSSASPRRRASTRPSPSQTPSTSVLPPPIIPYPTQQPLSVHPHLVPFYPVYPHHHPHHPVYISVSPSSTSPPFTATPAAPPPVQAPRSPAGDVPSPNGNGLATAAYYSAPPPPPTVLHTSPASRPSTADERELARKVSHSAIERRRRERINDKIIQLRQLIPSCADQEHLNKMTILQSAIDYITHLKHTVEKADERQKHQRRVNDNDGDNEEETTTHVPPPPSRIKSPQPMVPKEVAPFTSQFALNKSPPTPTMATTKDNDQHQHQPLRGLKPMDIIDARKHGLGRTVNRPATSSPSETSNTNMSVDAMLCGK